MPKIDIKVTINNEIDQVDYKVKAIIEEDLIKYLEPDKTVTTFNYQDNTLLRENNELRMEYHFDIKKHTEGFIIVKEIDKTIKVKVKTNKIERNNHNIKINFNVEEKDFIYEIEEIKWV